MLFTESIFLFVFFPIAIAGFYALLPLKNKIVEQVHLIVFSLIFYFFAGDYFVQYLLTLILLVYFMGKILENAPSHQRKKRRLIISLALLLMVLIFYKYMNNVLEYMDRDEYQGFYLDIDYLIMPLGLSFIIFEAISYLLDIYWQKTKSGNLLETALFLSFFPKITSGPIVLWRDFAPKIKKRQISIDSVYSGIEKIMMGYIKKAMIADPLGLLVHQITTDSASGIYQLTAIGGVIAYSLQIYYDFSGYSDIAIGLSRLFGFCFEENFNYPYTSVSINEFWRRWHISLGRWFREYLYIPLGGNRKRKYFNLFIVFLVTGIWHGSTINFLIWGLLHGILVIAERLVENKNWYQKTPVLVRWAFLMVFIGFTWIIFMMPDMVGVKTYLKTLLGQPAGPVYFSSAFYFTPKNLFLILVGTIGALIGKADWLQGQIKLFTDTKIGVVIKVFVLLTLFMLAILFMVNSTYSPFLYFQF